MTPTARNSDVSAPKRRRRVSKTCSRPQEMKGIETESRQPTHEDDREKIVETPPDLDRGAGEIATKLSQLSKFEKIPPNCVDDSYIRLKNCVKIDFEKLNTSEVNENLKNHLNKFDSNEQKYHLERIFKQCYNSTNGSLSKCKNMMAQLEAKTFVNIEILDLTSSLNKNKLSVSKNDDIKTRKKIRKNKLINRIIDKEFIELFGKKYLESKKKCKKKTSVIENEYSTIYNSNDKNYEKTSPDKNNVVEINDSSFNGDVDIQDSRAPATKVNNSVVQNIISLPSAISYKDIEKCLKKLIKLEIYMTKLTHFTKNNYYNTQVIESSEKTKNSSLIKVVDVIEEKLLISENTVKKTRQKIRKSKLINLIIDEKSIELFGEEYLKSNNKCNKKQLVINNCFNPLKYSSLRKTSSNRNSVVVNLNKSPFNSEMNSRNCEASTIKVNNSALKNMNSSQHTISNQDFNNNLKKFMFELDTFMAEIQFFFKNCTNTQNVKNAENTTSSDNNIDVVEINNLSFDCGMDSPNCESSTIKIDNSVFRNENSSQFALSNQYFENNLKKFMSKLDIFVAEKNVTEMNKFDIKTMNSTSTFDLDVLDFNKTK